MKFTLSLMVLLAYFLASCGRNAPFLVTSTASVSEAHISLPTRTATPTATPLPTLTFTPEPYREYSIAYLRARTYGGGAIEITEALGQNTAFTRHFFLL